METALRVRPEAVTDLWVNAERTDARMQALEGVARGVGVRVQHVGSKTLDKVAVGGTIKGLPCGENVSPTSIGRLP